MKTIAIVSWAILSVAPSWAQQSPIRELYSNVLAQSSGEGLPKGNELFGKVNEITVGALQASEAQNIVPLALQCIQSTDIEKRRYGYAFFISAIMRPDSANLLGPYIDDLGQLLNENDPAPRRTILYLMGSMRPQLPAKAITYLRANLENSRNSNEEILTVAVSLLNAVPGDASTLHKVVVVVANRDDIKLTSGVLRQLGLSKSRLPEAMDFISANLNKEDPSLRASAVDAVSRLDHDKRVLFTSQLAHIASDPAEEQYVRKQATAALEP